MIRFIDFMGTYGYLFLLPIMLLTSGLIEMNVSRTIVGYVYLTSVIVLVLYLLCLLLKGVLYIHSHIRKK